jgi:outer membrane protein TolC
MISPKTFLSVFLLLSCGVLGAQDTVVLSERAFLATVVERHPLARKADLLPEAGEALVRAARGGFDPRIVGGFDQKDYNGKEYYQTLDLGLQVPTWYGIKALAGYEHNEGQYLNPADNTPPAGLAAIGLEWTPLRGLVIDKRRAALQKAKLYAEANIAGRKGMLNDLLAEATGAYWEWVRAWHSLEVYNSAVELAELRLNAVRGGWRSGARPAIDTTEAALLYQARLLDQSAADYKYRKARFVLETYLWSEENAPLELGPRVRPPALTEIPQVPIPLPPVAAFDSILESHPEVLAYALKVEQLEVEQRLQAEQLKPDLSVKWQFLGTPPGTQASSSYEFGLDNYKVGLGLSFPVFVREARGNAANARLMVDAAEYDLYDKRRNLYYKIQNLHAAHAAALAQASLSNDMVEGSTALKLGEDRRFEVGESSLFLVNTREQNLIKARLEQVGLLTTLPILRMELFRATGGAYLLDFGVD